MAHGRKRAKRTRIPIRRLRFNDDGRGEWLCELCGDWTKTPRFVPEVTHAESGMVLWPSFFVCESCHKRKGHTLRPARRVAPHEYPQQRAFNMVTRQESARPGTAPSGSGHKTDFGPNSDHTPRGR